MEAVGIKDIIKKLREYHNDINKQSAVPTFLDPQIFLKNGNESPFSGHRNSSEIHQTAPDWRPSSPRNLRTTTRQGSTPTSRSWIYMWGWTIVSNWRTIP